MFFEEFQRQKITVNKIEMFVVTGGKGPPLYLLHGFPQTHVIWHKVAPQLAKHFSLVIPDLRGYGQSDAPPTDENHTPYSKREMAKDIVALADHFGHPQFALAAHDRGARVGYRLVLDNPGRVIRFCSIDVIPTLDAWEEMDADAAIAQYHWPFLAVPSPLPETLIGKDPNFFFRHLIERWAGDVSLLGEPAIQAYVAQYRDPKKIHAQCEDYRAGASIDRTLDEADRSTGTKLDCPVMILWGRGYLGDKAKSPKGSWENWAHNVEEVTLDCGHFIVEEMPKASLQALLGFFGSSLT
jgi:haloacetate dehalogenase